MFIPTVPISCLHPLSPPPTPRPSVLFSLSPGKINRKPYMLHTMKQYRYKIYVFGLSTFYFKIIWYGKLNNFMRFCLKIEWKLHIYWKCIEQFFFSFACDTILWSSILRLSLGVGEQKYNNQEPPANKHAYHTETYIDSNYELVNLVATFFAGALFLATADTRECVLFVISFILGFRFVFCGWIRYAIQFFFLVFFLYKSLNGWSFVSLYFFIWFFCLLAVTVNTKACL